MELSSLEVIRAGEVVRRVEFHRGLNLVIDASTKKSTESGNNVGKTTFLRVIDYCLGGDITSVYVDSESGEANEAVRNDLEKNRVSFRLTLSRGQTSHIIERGLGRKALIDGVDYSDAEFTQRLNEMIFGLSSKRPTFRQLIGKFVRIEPYQISNTIKFLYHRTAAEDYEPIYLFLFGNFDAELLTQRRALFKGLRDLEAQRRALKAAMGPGLTSELKRIRERIEQLEAQRKALKFAPSVHKELDLAASLQKEIAQTEGRIAQSELIVQLGKQTIAELQAATEGIDRVHLKRTYEQAKRFIPSLNKSFDDLVDFAERLSKNKIDFVNRQMTETQGEIESDSKMLDALLAKLEPIVKSMAAEDGLASLEKIQHEVSGLYQELGKNEALTKTLEQVNSRVADARKQLEANAETISAFEQTLHSNVETFNERFLRYSKELYNEEYRLKVEKKESKTGEMRYNFRVENVGGNIGAGKKRAQVIAFDLAFIEFAEDAYLLCPRFSIHDRVEEVHDNQLRTLLDLSDSVPGQLVVAMLRGRLLGRSESWIKKHEIMVLSETDRFLRIEV